jgi:VanZ family protein
MPRRPLIARVSLWLPPLAYMALIFYLSSQSNPLPEITSRVWDKLLHALEYAALAALLARALLGEGVAPLATFVAAACLAGAYGASDEYHQMFVALRNADVRDWIVDTIGAFLGALAYVAQGPNRLKPDPTGRSSTA